MIVIYFLISIILTLIASLTALIQTENPIAALVVGVGMFCSSMAAMCYISTCK